MQSPSPTSTPNSDEHTPASTQTISESLDIVDKSVINMSSPTSRNNESAGDVNVERRISTHATSASESSIESPKSRDIVDKRIIDISSPIPSDGANNSAIESSKSPDIVDKSIMDMSSPTPSDSASSKLNNNTARTTPSSQSSGEDDASPRPAGRRMAHKDITGTPSNSFKEVGGAMPVPPASSSGPSPRSHEKPAHRDIIPRRPVRSETNARRHLPPGRFHDDRRHPPPGRFHDDRRRPPRGRFHDDRRHPPPGRYRDDSPPGSFHDDRHDSPPPDCFLDERRLRASRIRREQGTHQPKRRRDSDVEEAESDDDNDAFFHDLERAKRLKRALPQQEQQQQQQQQQPVTHRPATGNYRLMLLQAGEKWPQHVEKYKKDIQRGPWIHGLAWRNYLRPHCYPSGCVGQVAGEYKLPLCGRKE
ncbi:hypothetical protein FN846DRAFT_922449 [Sphaerosporella brunnea]|uniref:Uncharacterized protein n=1 Tax=Sphaerosporella brunnea TaxID=1250544 RepID=A0A5J5EHQ5_9PEZI|nr:hypothetical protein FN846DRAFT_922449 [Sphaerosporella brunnea]